MPTQYTRSDRQARSRKRTLLVALSAALLLFMQATVLEHQLDLDHHHDGEPCELCLHLAPLDHSLVNALTLTQKPTPPFSPASRIMPATLPRHHAAYHSRGPPRLS